jgi:hypothetical protein
MSPNTNEEDEKIDRLRVTPLTWPELKAIVNSNEPGGELYKLARNKDRQRNYRAFREQINNEWESIYDYLLCEKFGFDWVWSNAKDMWIEDDAYTVNDGSVIPPRRKKQSKPTFQDYISNVDNIDNECDTKLRLCINDFPYYYLPGIQHWILWKLGGELPTSKEIANAKKDILKESTSHLLHDPTQGLLQGNALERIINDDEVFLHWINPPHLRSLPGIDHVHILFNSELEL